MKIEAVDIVQQRNVPVPHKGKKKLPVPDRGISTIVSIQVSNGDHTRETGLGEIRAMGFLTGESANGAYAFARQLAAALVGAELPSGLGGMDAARASHTMVVDATKKLFGIDAENDLPDGLRPSVRLAFDCAILDAMARFAGKSVGALLGADDAPVVRNVVARSFAKPSDLLNSLLRGNRPAGWIRGSFARDGAMLASFAGAIAAASGGREDDFRGLCFDLDGRWKQDSLEAMLDGLKLTTAVRNSDLEFILEQPFPSRATTWYRDAIQRLSEADPAIGQRIRFLIGDNLTGAAALAPLARVIPHVDLKITPQACGSVYNVISLLERAREMGFVGRVYLGNAGMNTELNSLMLVTLANLIGEEVLFSADHKREDGSRIRQVWPQVSVDEDTPMQLALPEGDGWGARLCKSGLEKRLRKCDFLRPARIAVDPDSLKAMMILRAFDDSALNLRVIEADPDEEMESDDTDQPETGDADTGFDAHDATTETEDDTDETSQQP